MTATTTSPMTLWRLEVARLWRTRRWLIVVGVYGAFGVIGPLTARYINELLSRAGGEMQVIAPDPRPVDGIIQFVSNASQLGLLAVVVVAASALSLDAKPELAAFLRTKVRRPAVLVVAPYVVTTAAAIGSLLLGTAIAWALTASLIGPVPAGALVVGTLYGALYLAFATAVVAIIAGYTRSQATTVFAALGALLLLPIIGILDAVQPWLPSTLLMAVAATVEGTPAGEFWRAVVVSLISTAALLALAARRMDQREI